MKKYILPGLLLIAACRSERWKWTHLPNKIAWNEDTVVNYRIDFRKDHYFLYTTEDTLGQQKIIKGYGGRYWRSHDTIYLSFKGNVQPPMLSFMIVASGGYLSQQFRDHRAIMYFRYRFDITDPRHSWDNFFP